MFAKLLKKALLSGLFLIITFYVGSAQLSDYVSPYDCLRNTVSQTIQMDSDGDDAFDTYGFKYCGSDDVNTFPLQAIGDISRWPPLGVPTRSLVFSDRGGDVALMETYYDNSGDIIAWFLKASDNDTVYFHSSDENYDPLDFAIDSSGSYIQAFPNPADQVLKIHYIVAEADDIQIQLLTYEGQFLANIIRTPAGQGEYMMVFPVSQYANGYYRVRFISGSNNYMITVAIVH